MVAAEPSDAERRELRSLVERIKRGDCVLVLGPRVATRADDVERRPLAELLAAELVSSLGPQGASAAQAGSNLRRAADLYLRVRQDRVDLEITVQDFYARETGKTTKFHRDLAQLPFRLCVCASPDSLMLEALQGAQKSPQLGYYNFRQNVATRLTSPTPERPLVYHLFGYHKDPRSLVLTEGDLIEFLVAIVGGNPKLPDEVRSILVDRQASFLFLGFGFHNWYLRVLLQVLNVYGGHRKAIAFEDTQFFDDPQHDEAVGFFSGDRQIDFRPLRWEAFAEALRDAYAATRPGTVTRGSEALGEVDAGAPKAFLSYAREDSAAVEALAEALEARGIGVWQDKQDLRGGDNWERVLLDVISKHVDYVIVVQTAAMTTKLESFVHHEIAAALKRQQGMGEYQGRQFRFLLPARIGGAPSLASLRGLQEIDLGTDAGLRAIATSIQEDWDRRAALKAGPTAAA